jgi:hydrogenase/urease accessory protein HupE
LITLIFAPAMSTAALTCVVLATCFVPLTKVMVPASVAVLGAIVVVTVSTSPPLVVYIPKVKGTFGGILVAAEHHKQKAAGTSTNVEQKVTLLHVGGKVGAVKWDVAQYKNKDAAVREFTNSRCCCGCNTTSSYTN